MMTSRSLIGAAVAAALAAGPAAAQSRATLVPSLSLGAVYDDNVNARANGDAGRMLQLRPSLEADYESPKVTLISLWSFDMQRSNHSLLDALDARRHAMVDSRFRPSSFTTLSVAGRYDRSDSPGDIDFETGTLSRRHFAQRWELSPTIHHRAGARTTLNAVYHWTTEYLEGQNPEVMQSARAGLSRQVSTRSTIDVGYLGRLFAPNRRGPFADVFDRHQSHAALVGWTQQLTPTATLTLQAGPRQTTYRGLDAEVVAALNLNGQRVRWGVDYWHGETIILGEDGPVQIDSANLRYLLTATRRVEVGLRAGASDIVTLDGRDARVYRGSLLGSWTVAGPFTVTASYDADYQIGDIRRGFSPDDRVLRHVIRVGLTIAPSFSRSFLPSDEAARAKGVSR
jgi:hypothetical protein